MSDEEESSHVFNRQVEANRYVETCASQMLLSELQQYDRTIEGWIFGGVTDVPTRRRIIKATRALAKKLQKASER